MVWSQCDMLGHCLHEVWRELANIITATDTFKEMLLQDGMYIMEGERTTKHTQSTKSLLSQLSAHRAPLSDEECRSSLMRNLLASWQSMIIAVWRATTIKMSWWKHATGLNQLRLSILIKADYQKQGMTQELLLVKHPLLIKQRKDWKELRCQQVRILEFVSKKMDLVTISRVMLQNYKFNWYILTFSFFFSRRELPYFLAWKVLLSFPLGDSVPQPSLTRLRHPETPLDNPAK